MEKRKERVDLAELVNRLAGETTLRASRKNIHFRFRMEHVSAPHVLTDGEALTMILSELLKNAVDYTPYGGDVILGVAEIKQSGNETTLEFYVQDDGIGMDEEEQDRLFFKKEPGETGGAPQSGGRGIPGVLMAVREMGGTITCESMRNMGTVVRLIVNLEKDGEDQPRIPSDFSKDIYHFGGTHVLLVEDHPLNLDIAQSMLERVGVEVETAINGEEAVRLFKERGSSFDLILMDIRMPVMDGICAAKEIRESGGMKAKTIPIIALTASAYEGDAGRSRAAGMNASILKPIDPGKMYRLIREYLYPQTAVYTS